MKKIIIYSIKIYQNKKPDRFKNRCLFTPSCSEYMILSLNKYGLVKGLYYGLMRLFRCKPPNGGTDYP